MSIPHELVDMTLFFDEVKAEVTLAPQALLLKFTRQALIELCEKTYCWRESLTPISVVAGDEEYLLSAPDETMVATVLKVETNDNGATVGLIREQVDRGRWRYWQDRPDTIQLYPSDELDGKSVTIKAAVAPTRTSVQVAKVVYDDHVELILSGIRAQLFAMAGQEWSEPELAVFHSNQFTSGMDMLISRPVRGRNKRRQGG